MTAAERAVKAYGGASALARRLGVSRNAVWLWVKSGKVPAARVNDVAALTGLTIAELRKGDGNKDHEDIRSR